MQKVKEKFGKVVHFFKKNMRLPLENLLKFGFEGFFRSYVKTKNVDLNLFFREGVENMQLEETRLNEVLFNGLPFCVVSAHISKIQAKVDWKKLLEKSIVLYAEGINITLRIDLENMKKKKWRDCSNEESIYESIRESISKNNKQSNLPEEKNNIGEQVDSFKVIVKKILLGLKLQMSNINIRIELPIEKTKQSFKQQCLVFHMQQLQISQDEIREDQIAFEACRPFASFELKTHGIEVFLQNIQDTSVKNINQVECILCCAHDYELSSQLGIQLPRNQLKVSVDQKNVTTVVIPPTELMLNSFQISSILNLVEGINKENQNLKETLSRVDQKDEDEISQAQDQDDNNQQRKMRFYSFDYQEATLHGNSAEKEFKGQAQIEEILSEEEQGSQDSESDHSKSQNEKINKSESENAGNNQNFLATIITDKSQYGGQFNNLLDQTIEKSALAFEEINISKDNIQNNNNKNYSPQNSQLIRAYVQQICIYILKENTKPEMKDLPRRWLFAKNLKSINEFGGSKHSKINTLENGLLQFSITKCNFSFAKKEQIIDSTFHFYFRKLKLFDINFIQSSLKQPIESSQISSSQQNDHFCVTQVAVLGCQPVKKVLFQKNVEPVIIHRRFYLFQNSSATATTAFNLLASQSKSSILIEAHWLFLSFDFQTLSDISQILLKVKEQVNNIETESKGYYGKENSMFRKVRVTVDAMSVHYSLLNPQFLKQVNQQEKQLTNCCCQSEENSRNIIEGIDMSFEGLHVLITKQPARSISSMKLELWMSGNINVFITNLIHRHSLLRITSDKNSSTDPFVSFEIHKKEHDLSSSSIIDGCQLPDSPIKKKRDTLKRKQGLFFQQEQLLLVNVDPIHKSASLIQKAQGNVNAFIQNNGNYDDQIIKISILVSIPVIKLKLSKDYLDTLVIIMDGVKQEVKRFSQQSSAQKNNQFPLQLNYLWQKAKLILYINQLNLVYKPNEHDNITIEATSINLLKQQVLHLSIHDCILVDSQQLKPILGLPVRQLNREKISHKYRQHPCQEVVIYKQSKYISKKQYELKKQPIKVEIIVVLNRQNEDEKLNSSYYSQQRMIMIPKQIHRADKLSGSMIQLKYNPIQHQLKIKLFAVVLRLTDFRFPFIDELHFLVALLTQNNVQKNGQPSIIQSNIKSTLSESEQQQQPKISVQLKILNSALDVFQAYGKEFQSKNELNSILQSSREVTDKDLISQNYFYAKSRLVLLIPECTFEMCSQPSIDITQQDPINNQSICMSQFSTSSLEFYFQKLSDYSEHNNSILLLDNHYSFVLNPHESILKEMNFINILSAHSIIIKSKDAENQLNAEIWIGGVNASFASETYQLILQFLQLLEFNIGILSNHTTRFTQICDQYNNSPDSYNVSNLESKDALSTLDNQKESVCDISGVEMSDMQDEKIELKWTNDSHMIRKKKRLIEKRKRKIRLAEIEDAGIVEKEREFFDSEEQTKREQTRNRQNISVGLIFNLEDIYISLTEGQDFQSTFQINKNISTIKKNGTSTLRKREEDTNGEYSDENGDQLFKIDNNYQPKVLFSQSTSRTNNDSRNSTSRLVLCLRKAKIRMDEYLTSENTKKVTQLQLDHFEIKDFLQKSTIKILLQPQENSQKPFLNFEVESTRSLIDNSTKIQGGIKLTPVQLYMHGTTLDFLTSFFELNLKKDLTLKKEMSSQSQQSQDQNTECKFNLLQIENRSNDQSFDQIEVISSDINEEQPKCIRKESWENCDLITNHQDEEFLKITKDLEGVETFEIYETDQKANELIQQLQQQGEAYESSYENEKFNEKNMNSQEFCCGSDQEDDGSDQEIEDLSFSSCYSNSSQMKEKNYFNIERFEISEILIKIDYDARAIDLIRLINGFKLEAINLCSMKDISLDLPGLMVKNKNFSSTQSVLKTAFNTYKKDIINKQMNVKDIVSKFSLLSDTFKIVDNLQNIFVSSVDSYNQEASVVDGAIEGTKTAVKMISYQTLNLSSSLFSTLSSAFSVIGIKRGPTKYISNVLVTIKNGIDPEEAEKDNKIGKYKIQSNARKQ